MKKFFGRSQIQPVAEKSQERSGSHEPPGRQAGNSLLRGFSSLRQRNFRLYWSGQLISSLGSSMQSIGQTWLVLELTHSAWQLGLVGALQALPVLLFALFGGVFADRWPKRQVLFVTQLAALLQAGLLWALLVTGTLQLWQLYILALLLGVTNSLDLPTRRAFVVELVGRADLPNAVALNSSLSTLARVVGPGLGGLIIAASSPTALFLLNALSFIPVLLSLGLIERHALHARPLPEIAEKRKSTWQSLREGLSYVWQTPVVFLLILITGLVLLFGSNFNVWLPLFATNVLRAGAAGYGFLSAGLSAGSLLATFWLAWRKQRPALRTILLGIFCYGGIEVVFAFSRMYVLSLLLIASVGFTEIAFAALAMTLLQTVTPDHLSGRVIGVQVLLFDGTLPLGYLLMGWLTGSYGAPVAMLLGALCALLIAGSGWLWSKRAGVL